MAEPLADLVVRVRSAPGADTSRLVVTLADVCADRSGAPRARADVDVRGAVAVVVSLAVPSGDGAMTARLLDGVGDALRSRGVDRVRLSAELAL
jgi:hypothetical protein